MAQETSTDQQTALHDRHVGLGARMVSFAGWNMPIQYTGILAEHRAVRTAAGLFDLGHMGQVSFAGPDALAFLQWTTTNDVSALEPGKAHYALLPNETGGVVDDIIVYRQPEGQDGYMVVVNASNRERDVAWWEELRSRRDDFDVGIQDISNELGMLAVQGPVAETITSRTVDVDLSGIDNFSWRRADVAGVSTMIARTGYTGEDGFEFYAANEDIGIIWDALLKAGEQDGLVPVGLGARDTLRLEARMPLYGQELGDDISPYEAGLGWAVKLEAKEFIGREPMAQIKAAKPPRRAVGFTTVGRTAAPRSHCPVIVDGKDVGYVTSGAFSPTLQKNVGLALISREFAGVGKSLQIDVRGKLIDAEQVKTPFYKRDDG
ncbi:MAG: glycine cleavage system aminomethyltransferase GcvT [Chloroflexia bacterium]|jgi:aminomethyltransferase|nr:glycine cleavage system aminomethyltransferase GcvT [Chloroflexia bacterium]MDQ3614668.1 glycine cleavage system aminomethyltransferase GcvT [Chloroflexota bacterium]